ncbi:MAG TPA: zinc transporter ZntB [Gammaproteobacteria bacterium]|nr:zinc transporter ZntB [Gammaproteobacteria bacterium]
MSDTHEALICAYRGGPEGALRQTDWSGIRDWQPEAGTLWVHLNRKASESRRWLESDSGLPGLVIEALLQEETRPRIAPMPGGLLVILRGVNLNPGANPEDMVSIRMWIERDRLITLRGPRLLAVQDVRDDLDAGRGPATAAEVLAALAESLIARMGPVVVELDEALDTVEETLLTQQSRDMRARLIALRRQGIILRRYIAPQREVLARLASERFEVIADTDRARLREVSDRVARYMEDLEAVRDRAAVAQEELANRLTDRMNRTMYLLSVVATLFLPLSFVTGLLGVNVGGIPGADDPSGFIVLSIILAVTLAAEAAIFWISRSS